ncbi:hypothetical protein [Neisseria meningitidis]|uniref:hypothetical protein n=1 Tax=Neisseria meningitidis TaxID=487 RepID=UPI001E5AF130|nr:hypothetical protein [Neisseria meningitidis]
MPSEVGFGGFRRFHTAGMRLHQNKIPPAFLICPPRFLQNKPPAPLLQKAVRHSEYPEPRYKMTFQTAFAPPRFEYSGVRWSYKSIADEKNQDNGTEAADSTDSTVSRGNAVLVFVNPL